MTSVRRRDVYHKLRRQVCKDVLLGAFTVLVHIGEQLVLLGEQPMHWQLVDEFLLPMDTQLLEVDTARDGRPLETVQGQVSLL